MTKGGWRNFREQSKHAAIAVTAAEELERPAVVRHGISLPPDEPPLPVHETTPLTAPELEAETPEDFDPSTRDADPDRLFQQAVALMTPDWPAAPVARPSRLRAAMLPHMIGWAPAQSPIETLKQNWHVAAIVPVAAGASLLAVWAGVNPYALCLQWWDFLYGAIFLSSSMLFVGLAIWKGGRGSWHPGAPALAIVVGVIPFWVATNFAFGTACQEAHAAAPAAIAALPPLPPPIEVAPLWPVPTPMPRPTELNYNFTPRQLDLRTSEDVQLYPPPL